MWGLESFSWSLIDIEFWILFFTFIIPANLFVYGINDLSDRDTDINNIEKKGDVEHLLVDSEQKKLAVIVGMLFVGMVVLGVWLGGLIGVLMWAFVFLAGGYSMKPLRFKARLGWDFISNIFYVIPGWIGYVYATGNMPPTWVIVGSSLWPMAMHLFSAIPDIESDKKAEVVTSAVKLGRNNSVVLCLCLWFIAGGLLVLNGGIWGILGIVYVLVGLIALFISRNGFVRLYWMMPVVNTLVGLVLFWGRFISIV